MIRAAESRLSDAIAAEIDHRGLASVALLVGRGKSTIYSRGADPTHWPLIDVARLAEACPMVRDAALALFRQEQQQADARRAVASAAQAMPDLISEAMAIADALRDQRITRAEARAILAGLPDLQRRLADLAADCSRLLRAP